MKKDRLFPPKVEFITNPIKTSERFYCNCLIEHTKYTKKLRSIALIDVDKNALYKILARENDGEKLLQHLYNIFVFNRNL